MCIKMSHVRLSNASPTLERVDARQPDSTRPSVRRCLFGSPDPEELRDIFEASMEAEERRFRDTYNFDPVEHRPLSPGRYRWEVDENAPEFYRRPPHGRLSGVRSRPRDQVETRLRDQVQTAPGDQVQTAPEGQVQTATGQTAPEDQVQTAPEGQVQTAPGQTAPGDQVQTAPEGQVQTATGQTAPEDQVQTAPGQTAPEDQVQTAPGQTAERSRKRPSDPSGSSCSGDPHRKSSRTNGDDEDDQADDGIRQAAQVPEQAPEHQ